MCGASANAADRNGRGGSDPLLYRQRVPSWYDEQVVGPTNDLLSGVPVGSKVTDLDRCEPLAEGIDGLFRSEAPGQYEGWPRESTTDGTRIDLCVRVAEDALDAAGMTWIDFDGDLFPSRCVIRRSPDGSVHVTGYIGLVDEQTGAPPRLPRGTLVVAVHNEDAGMVHGELILGRRQIPIEWTKAFEFGERHPM
jgi:hypothetical protein